MRHRIFTYFGLLFSLLLIFASAEAKKPVELKKFGAEFTVSKEGYRPDVAELNDGGFVVVWRAASPNGVKAQRYNSQGKKVGGAIDVIRDSQEFLNPVVSGLANGGFVVAYEYDDGSGLGVYVQRYTADGKQAGNPVRANTYRLNDQYYPTIAGLKNGGFAVVWSSRYQDEAYAAIIGRLFSKAGVPKGGEFRVDTTYPNFSHEYPAVGALNKGGFVVAWNANGAIRAQRYTSNAKKRGKSVLVSPSETIGRLLPDLDDRPADEAGSRQAAQIIPDVAGTAKKRFVVTREVLTADGDGTRPGVSAQRYKRTGRPLGDRVVVNKKAAGFQGNHSVTGLNNGGFAIVWDGENVVHGRIFNGKVRKASKVFKINKSDVPSEALPAIAAHGQTGFVAVWWSGEGIKGRRFGGLQDPGKDGKRGPRGARTNDGSRDDADASIVSVIEASHVNRIVLENELPGTPRSVWGVDGDGDENIQGFATDISVNVGETVDFKINTNSTNYRIDIYRIGYYGGDGARLVDSIVRQLAQPQVQPAPLVEAARGLVDAGNWAVSASWTVPTDAVSGIYFARLERQDGTPGVSLTPFVVRDDGAATDIVFQTSDTTWQAYNAWGGASLYENQLQGGTDSRAYAVSYNRPYKINTSVYGGPWDYIFTGEYAAIRWLERNGYDVSYISGVDVARSGNLLLDHKVFLSVGHDEYWSAEQRANVEAARDAGVNLAFWSGNTSFWKTRWEPSIDGSGTDFRTLITYKETRANTDIDPSPIATATWRDPRFQDPGQEPENALMGTMFTVDSYRTDSIDIPYEMSRFRFWNNTSIAGLQPGQTATLVPPLLGYEWDSDVDNGYRPDGLVNLSSSTVSVNTYLRDYGLTTGDNPAVPHSLTMYRSPSGALVFSAATVYWAFGLDTEHDADQMPADPDIRQAMVNMFADMDVQPATLDPSLVPAVASTDLQAPASTISTPTAGASFVEGERVTITGTATDSGGGRVAGVEVSVDGGETWHKATGREAWSYVWAVQAAGNYTIQSRAVDDSYRVETPAAGQQVTVDLPETSSLWTLSAKPDEEAVMDYARLELGVRFSASTSGSISAIRFYKGPLNIGTHIVRLWTGTGTLLATGTSTNEPYSGWQSVLLDTPVQINAGTTYVASYSSDGLYSTTSNYFGTTYNRGPLSVPAGGSVYAYGPSGTFPQFSYQNENYWVDVVFEPSEPTVNQSPVAVNDSGFATLQDTPLALSAALLLANDSDPDGDTLTVTGVSAPSNGTVSLNSGTVTFTPATGYTGPAGFTYAISDGRGGTASATVALTVTTVTPPGEGISLFAPTDTPAILADVDPSPVELGVKFTTSTAGTVTAIRYYKSALDTGTHVGSLWTAGGTRLAQVIFTGETNSGWQQATLASPVPLTAGTTYVVSYHSNGRYPATANFFNGAHTNGPLTAPSSAASGGNGVYLYGSGGFPTQTYSATNYWADIVFVPAAGSNQPPVAVNDSGFTTSQNTPLALATLTLLANDSDPDGDTLTVTGVSAPSNGTVALNSGTVTFTPTAGYTGPAGFTYAISDGQGGTASATVSLTVSPAANQPPVAVNDSGFTTPQDTPLAMSAALLLANDSDPDGDPLTVTGVSAPSNGTVSLNSGTVTFTPATGYTGPAGFTYAISDGRGGTASATVALTVTTVTPPGEGISLFAPTDTPAILADVDPSPVELGVKFTTSTAGTVTAIRYYKSALDTGTHVGSLWTAGGTRLAQVIFTGETNSGWQQATLASPVPLTAGNTYVVSYHSNGRYPATANFFNGAHTNGPLTAPSSAASGGNGVYLYGSGGFPTQTYNATNYWADIVFVPAAGSNQPPVAVNDSGFTTSQDTPLGLSTSTLLANDSDPDGDTLTVTGVSAASNGTVALNSGTVTFTPTAGYSGPAGFTYAISDGQGGTASATVSLTVSPAANQPPVAVNDGGFTTSQDTPLALSAALLLVNDSDPDGDPLTVTGVSAPSNGTVLLNSGTVTFTPATGYTGPAGFSYAISDGRGGTASATVALTVSPAANQPPVAVNDSGFTTPQDTPLAMSAALLLANDSDPDGDPLTVTGVSAPSNGTVSLNSGTVTFTPATGYTGPAGFTYAISDGRGGTASAAVALTVTTVTPPGEGISLFAPTDTPAILSANDPSPVELGVKFTTSSAGAVTAIRYYKGAQDTGTHIGSLWTSTGTRLAQVTFTGESSSGWQQATLASPVPLTAGTTYVVSYHSNGGYAATLSYFTTARTSGPLTAPSSGSSGGNGVYLYGSGAFPTQNYNAANYWVDVVFEQSSSQSASLD
ncbi:DUF4082 domain-containing protein [Microbaculum sp. FT89]|uniref:DUF4082 domain-containing protein n=1 Tax=Microbaculum sp. FT89 TaxID=3447298 RepID=UPI003F52A183